ncbi:MAG: SLOG family protein [Christensenellales bacterium]|jgi:uncharacterized phage-like protein YoqJ
MKKCCFTGHRPKIFPWHNNEADNRCIKLKARLKAEIINAISLGYTYFITGGALGVDTWAAEIILDEKKTNRNIVLELALPFESHNKIVDSQNDAKRLDSIRDKADFITVVANNESILESFRKRDRYMVDQSDKLIAVYDDGSGIKSGTYRTLEYAKAKGLLIAQINWMDC